MKKKMVPTKDRPAMVVEIRLPVDMVEELKKLALVKGMYDYRALMGYYLGKGLREDLHLSRAIDDAIERDEVFAELLREGNPDRVEEIHSRLGVITFGDTSTKSTP